MERIIIARFRCNARHITIVQCYAPTEDASDDVKDDFYNALTSSLTRIEKGDIKILMGDFNAKIGPNNNGLETIMGRHGVGTRSNNGDRLIDLCQTFQLVIGGTYTEEHRGGDAWHPTTQAHGLDISAHLGTYQQTEQPKVESRP
ncbi:craniofacial development protein 2-like [Drosophila bipectinata]|uniref:craniofacial development protein 2-like n=1 Tax=Drosophila bipectinata TaxID=42026 RepID=UPI001C89D454|nr:craniofacial development protein 2-like [Drosophila bipectinata]